MKMRYLILWSTLILLGLWAVLSVWGAFAGPRRAGEFFNSPVMAIFWIGLLALLIAGVPFCYRRIGMLMIHAGLIFILAGGLWGSQKSHEIRNRPYKGYLYLFENAPSDTMADLDRNFITKLPFQVTLEKFAIEYYDNGDVKDYISTLSIGGVRKDIEVNHPLHWNGYHFYQSAWGQSEAGRYSVIQVVSDSGVAAVFCGYALLAAGIICQLWRRRGS